MSIQNISNVIFEIKEQLTDKQFKTIMDELMNVNKQLPNNQLTENDWCNLFYKQHFYHSNTNNRFYKHQYLIQDGSILLYYDNTINRLCIGHKFIYEKIFDTFDDTIENVEATIKRVMPKYTVLTINNFDKKISNLTLNKIVQHPYITIM